MVAVRRPEFRVYSLQPLLRVEVEVRLPDDPAGWSAVQDQWHQEWPARRLEIADDDRAEAPVERK